MCNIVVPHTCFFETHFMMKFFRYVKFHNQLSYQKLQTNLTKRVIQLAFVRLLILIVFTTVLVAFTTVILTTFRLDF